MTGTSITVNYVPATGVLTLTGPDALANFQTVLRKVRYQNTDVDPDTTARVIHFVANDGITNSNTAVSTVTLSVGRHAADRQRRYGDGSRGPGGADQRAGQRHR